MAGSRVSESARQMACAWQPGITGHIDKSVDVVATIPATRRPAGTDAEEKQSVPKSVPAVTKFPTALPSQVRSAVPKQIYIDHYSIVVPDDLTVAGGDDHFTSFFGDKLGFERFAERPFDALDGGKGKWFRIPRSEILLHIIPEPRKEAELMNLHDETVANAWSVMHQYYSEPRFLRQYPQAESDVLSRTNHFEIPIDAERYLKVWAQFFAGRPGNTIWLRVPGGSFMAITPCNDDSASYMKIVRNRANLSGPIIYEKLGFAKTHSSDKEIVLRNAQNVELRLIKPSEKWVQIENQMPAEEVISGRYNVHHIAFGGISFWNTWEQKHFGGRLLHGHKEIALNKTMPEEGEWVYQMFMQDETNGNWIEFCMCNAGEMVRPHDVHHLALRESKS